MASELIVQTLKGPTSGANANKVIVPSGQTLTAPGHVLQVVQAVKTDTFTTTTSSFLDVPSLAVSITPSSTSSKVLITCNICGQVEASSGSYGSALRLLRGTTVIGVGDAGGSRVQCISTLGGQDGNEYANPVSFQYLDSPSSTSSLTYKVQTRHDQSKSQYFNVQAGDSNISRYIRPICVITAMEIAG